MKKVTIYTDGAARGNPGKGGYGAILMYGAHQKKIAQGFLHTTNNRMELLAVIEAIKLLKEKPLHITVYSDSKYVVDAVTKGWLQTWIKTNFKGDKKNPDLWIAYNKLAMAHKVEFVWVKGHATNVYNNECDRLATKAADGKDLIEDIGYVKSNTGGPIVF